MSTAEAELLQDYLAGSQSAFAALVSRHVDLIYSAALRQVRTPQLAEEITQNAFVALARHAHRLKPGTPLVAWLYVVTRRAAIDALRAESRRHEREQIAMEMTVMNSSSPDWPRIEPFLDEAMETLGEQDRSAILLRYFEDKSLREIGAALGTSEDAAQKRVSRALDQLRAFFSKRGVAIGAGSLATSLSAHAVQSAPIGLGLSISSTAAVASAVAAPAAAGGATKIIVMTTLQKTLLATTVALGIGVGFYEREVISRQEDQLGAARREVESLHAQMRQVQRERDAATARWAAMQSEIDAARAKIAIEERSMPSRDLAAESEMKAVLDRASELKRRIAELPGARARAAGVLTKEDWIKVVLNNRLETEADVRKALDDIQNQVKLTWANTVQAALAEFIKVNGGMLPSDTAQLAPFLPPGSDLSVLQRFQMLRTGNVNDFSSNAWLAADLIPADDDAEPLFMFGRGDMHWGDGDASAHRVVLRAYVEFVRSHNGQPPADAQQLQPYLRQPIDPRQLQSFWKQQGHLLR